MQNPLFKSSGCSKNDLSSLIFQLEKQDEELIKFWQVSDVHLDYLYDQQGDPKDWCHTDDNPDTKSGTFGNYRCDGTQSVLDSAIKTMRVREPKPDFILWTGDTAPHWYQPSQPDWNYIFKAERDMVGKLKRSFPDSLVLPALGNHDSFPADFFPDGKTDVILYTTKSPSISGF